MSFCLAFLTPPKKSAWMAMIKDMNRMMVGVMFLIVTSHSVSVTRHVSHSVMFVDCNAPPPLNVMVSI